MAVVSRIKVMGRMDIAERRVPQDGRATVTMGARAPGDRGARSIDLRISTLPTSYGERAVVRLLDNTQQLCDFDRLGMPPRVAEAFLERARQQRHHPGHRPHWLGQDDDPLLDAAPDRLRRGQHHDHRGSDRVRALGERPGDQPGAGERTEGRDVRHGASAHPEAGPRRRDGRRDPGCRDGADRDPVEPDRAPGLLDAAHERRGQRDHAAHRPRSRALPGERLALGGPGAAAGAGDPPALRRARVRRLRRHGLPGPHGHLRADHGGRAHPGVDQSPGAPRRDPGGGEGEGARER